MNDILNKCITAVKGIGAKRAGFLINWVFLMLEI